MDRSIQNSIKDHRQWGRDLELFSFHEEGPGFPFFLSKGIALKNALIDVWRRKHRQAGYEELQSPMLLDKKLWQKSGHWDLYRDNMYISEVEKREFAIKPMNCPGAILHYQEKPRSHKELPFRVAELGQVHRDELSGALNGLLRVRSFVVDDAHIFCRPEQVLSEVKNILQLALELLGLCGFKDYVIELSLREESALNSVSNSASNSASSPSQNPNSAPSPSRSSISHQKYLGEDSEWRHSESMLARALEESGLPFVRKPGEAKFYGPAIDLKIKDNAGRLWQCSSIQMDFNLAHRFGLHYFDEHGAKQAPLILHRCIYGSLERLIAVLLEHHQGRLPFWLSPVQAQVIAASSVASSPNASSANAVSPADAPMSAGPPREKLFYDGLFNELEALGIRYQVDERNINLSKKIKQAQQMQIPIMLIIGDREISGQRVSIRKIDGSQRNNVELKELSKEVLKLQVS